MADYPPTLTYIQFRHLYKRNNPTSTVKEISLAWRIHKENRHLPHVTTLSITEASLTTLPLDIVKHIINKDPQICTNLKRLCNKLRILLREYVSSVICTIPITISEITSYISTTIDATNRISKGMSYKKHILTFYYDRTQCEMIYRERTEILRIPLYKYLASGQDFTIHKYYWLQCVPSTIFQFQDSSGNSSKSCVIADAVELIRNVSSKATIRLENDVVNTILLLRGCMPQHIKQILTK